MSDRRKGADLKTIVAVEYAMRNGSKDQGPEKCKDMFVDDTHLLLTHQFCLDAVLNHIPCAA
ncbi:hypothetical protein AF72_00340 [Xylella taiwanensis]|uniref:Uncharacterized protein n=1 Tax=Xylella taiwanensis TaxID=1444770 RepID=Z9JN55_9GAMM|nr:hypothetical protein AB672_11660 [Xylella taiwanensis]EWS79433.1 hypothetical protein AF72_00340 [Xylella taiwanensis]